MKVFADTFFFLAMLDSGDPAHEQALEQASRPWSEIVTTEFVLTELGNALCRVADREAFLAVLDLIQSTPVYRIIPASTQVFSAAVEHFRSRMDKEWSLTDCSSMCVMRELGLRHILTGDHHFTQAGLEILLC